MTGTRKNQEWILLLFLFPLLFACRPSSPPTPASLKVQVVGVAGAPVEVTALGHPRRVFLGTVAGQVELSGLAPGRYRIDGRAVEGIDPKPVEADLGPGQRAEVAVVYPIQATLTVRLAGTDRAGVVISREGRPVYAGEVAGHRAFSLEPGRYTVDGQPAAGTDPPAVDVELGAREDRTLTLDYAAPPPPPAPGVGFLAPPAGATLDQPTLHVEVEVRDPGLYQALHVALQARGVLKVWSVVPGQTRYAADLVLDPDSYNGPHTLLARVQKNGQARWEEAASQPLTVAIPWKGSAYLELAGLPSAVALEPGQERQFTFTARSRNGFEGEARFSADPLSGVAVRVAPESARFAVGEEKNLTLTVAVDPPAASGTRRATVRWRDAWDLRSGYQEFAVRASRPPTPRFTDPASPWTGRPVPLEATVEDDGTMKEVRFYVDGSLLARDDAAPYRAQWDPGLLANGPHRLRAEAEDRLGFVGTTERALELAVPLGVRRTLPLPSAPSGAPIGFGGAVYLAAGAWVVRLTGPADAPQTLALPAPVHRLLAWNGHLYAATATGVQELAPDLSSATPVWTGVSDFRALVAGSEPVAVYGDRLRALVSGTETALPAPPTAAAATASLVFLGYPSGRIERRILGSGLPPEAATADEPIADLTVANGALWQSAPGRVWRYPLAFNLLKSPDAFAAADWTRENLRVETDVAADPGGEPRADRVSREPTGTAPFRIYQTARLDAGDYAFGVYAKGDPRTALTLRAVRVSDQAVLGQLGPRSLAETDPWGYLEAPFRVAAGGTEVRLEIALEATADPALLSQARLWPTPKAAFPLCGAPNPFQPGGLFTDADGCVFRLGQGKLLDAGTPLLPAVGEAWGRLYLAATDGGLTAWEAGARRASERPVQATPVGGFLAQGLLYLGYRDGTLRILDPLP